MNIAVLSFLNLLKACFCSFLLIVVFYLIEEGICSYLILVQMNAMLPCPSRHLKIFFDAYHDKINSLSITDI